MNKQSNITHVSVSALIFALSLLPAAAFARNNEDSGATLPVNVSTHIDVGDNEGTSADSTTTTEIQTGDENNNSDNHNQSDEASSTKHHREGDNQPTNSGRESDEADSEIEVDHNSAENASTTIDTPEHVSNHGELRSFLNHVIKEDGRISDVHVSSTTIETHYEMPAKFLWTIPTNLTADITVNSGGSVTVTYPWYAFLFAKHDSDLATQLEQSAATSTSASTTLSASAQAHLLNLLFSILKASTGQ